MSLSHWLLLILAILYSSNTLAAIDLNRLKLLFLSGDSQGTYNYAVSELYNYEGEPEFDYYFGTAAIDTGHGNEGVYALERVILSQPNNQAARLELARGYFILQEYSRARLEFELALSANPPEDVRKKIINYLDSIRLQENRYKTTSSAYVETGFEFDSNVNSGPTDSTITFLGQTGKLDASALEKSDSLIKLKANYGISSPLTRKLTLNINLTGNLKQNQSHDELNTSTYTESIGLLYLKAQDVFSIDIIAQQFSLDDHDYRDLLGINSEWSRHLSQQSTLQAFLQLSKQDFDGQEARNINSTSIGIGLTKQLKNSLSPIIFTSIFFANDNPDSNSDIAKQISERNYYGARIGTAINTSATTTVKISINLQNSEYGLEDINGVLRKDRYINTEFNFSYSLSRQWAMLIGTSYIKNDSNKSINTYNRGLANISIHYKMK